MSTDPEFQPQRRPPQPRMAPPADVDPLSLGSLSFARGGANAWMRRMQEVGGDLSEDQIRDAISIDFSGYRDVVLLAQKRYERLVKFRKAVRSQERGSVADAKNDMELTEQIDLAIFCWRTAYSILADMWDIIGFEYDDLKQPPEEAEE